MRSPRSMPPQKHPEGFHTPRLVTRLGPNAPRRHAALGGEPAPRAREAPRGLRPEAESENRGLTAPRGNREHLWPRAPHLHGRLLAPARPAPRPRRRRLTAGNQARGLCAGAGLLASRARSPFAVGCGGRVVLYTPARAPHAPRRRRGRSIRAVTTRDPRDADRAASAGAGAESRLGTVTSRPAVQNPHRPAFLKQTRASFPQTQTNLRPGAAAVTDGARRGPGAPPHPRPRPPPRGASGPTRALFPAPVSSPVQHRIELLVGPQGRGLTFLPRGSGGAAGGSGGGQRRAAGPRRAPLTAPPPPLYLGSAC